MWPWEHAIVGYLAYSLCCHLYYRDSPGGLEAFAVVFASVLPDLVDKPLAWEYGIFESGYALGHSIFVAVPLAIVVGVVARVAGRRRAGIAFGIGYFLHLPGDVLYHYVLRDVYQPELLFWPVQTVPPSPQLGFFEYTTDFLAVYRAHLFASDLSTYVWLQLGTALAVFVLWLYDGAPVLRELVVGSQRLLLGAIGDPPSERENAGR